MNRVIWLKTARVYAQDSDMTAKVERNIIKLEDGDNWNKFVKYVNLKGYKKDEMPSIEKVMEKNASGEWKVVDPTKWVDQLNEALKKVPISDDKIDFKMLAEKQANELKESKANFAALEERLRALEANDYKGQPLQPLASKEEEVKEDKDTKEEPETPAKKAGRPKQN